MDIAPLIHSRTKYCDFNTNFAVRPADLNVNWAMGKILPSTRDIDILNGARLVVAFNGEMGIAGISCKLKSFIEKNVPDAVDEAKEYFSDERGREVKIFLGYVFKGDGVPNVSYADLWQMFKENLAPEWNYKTSQTVMVDYKSCKTKNLSDKIKPVETINGVECYDVSESTDKKIFEQCIAARKDFCSNIDQFKIIGDGNYKVITTSRSIMECMKTESQSKPEKKTPTQAQTPIQSQTTYKTATSQRRVENHDSTTIKFVATTIILVIIFMIGYLLI